MIVSVAVGWQIYDLTRDPFDLGIVGIVQFLPSLLLVLVTGVVADRFGRRLIMALATVVEAGCALVLLYFTLRGLVSPLPIFVVLALFGMARAFYGPASSSLFANLVPPEDFGNAIAWNSSAWQTATIIGPVAGGLLYGVSAEAAYAVASVLMLVAGLLIFTIPKPVQQTATDKPTMETLFAGFRYIWSEKIVLGAISLDLFAVLLSGASALLPVYARDILELGPWGLGLLRSAPGIGAICVAVWLAGHPLRDNAGKIMLGFVAAFGACTVLFGLSTVTWLSIVALGPPRRHRHVQRLHQGDADPVVDAGRGARPRQRRQPGLRRRLQRGRRIPRRHHGGADRHRAGRGDRRCRRHRGCRPVGLPVSATAQGAPSQRAQLTLASARFITLSQELP